MAQIFAIRLQKCLPKIISEHQNGYIKGRFIGFNIRTIIDVISYTNDTVKGVVSEALPRLTYKLYK